MKVIHIGILTAMIAFSANAERIAGYKKCEGDTCVYTSNGVTVKYNRGQWPTVVEGLWFDFTKAGSSEKLIPQEKKTISKSSNLTAPFIQWSALKQQELDPKNKKWMFKLDDDGHIEGTNVPELFIEETLFLQKFSISNPQEFSDLQTQFLRDFSSGKAMPQTTAQELASKSQFWYECKKTANGIQAVNELPASEVIQGLNNKYVFLKLKSNPTPYKVSAKELGADGEPNGTEVNMLESIVEMDSSKSILWASNSVVRGDFTLVTSPEICQKLEDSEVLDGFFSNPKERQKEIKQAIIENQSGVLYDPANECKGFLKYKIQNRLEKAGYKEISSIRGKSMDHVLMYGLAGVSFIPSVFYTDNAESCKHVVKKGSLTTPVGNIQIQSKGWFEELETKKFDGLVKSFAPNGLYISGENGKCDQVPSERLKEIVRSIDSTKLDENYFCTHVISLDAEASSKLMKKTISGVNIFAATLATIATGGVVAAKMKKDDLYNLDEYQFKNCIKAFSHDKVAGGDKTKNFKDRKLQFITRDKTQCENITNDYSSLNEDDFIAKYLFLTSHPKGGKR